ncbi:MAG: barstar family protein [Caldilineaceae bacterium]
MSSALMKLLEQGGQSGLFRISEDADETQILATAAANGWLACHLRGGEIADKHAFLTQMTAACGFPGYFGHNLDAFEEMLVDPSWRSAPGLLLLYDDPVTLARRDPAAWRMIYAILRQVTATPAPDAPLIVVFRKARMAIGP